MCLTYPTRAHLEVMSTSGDSSSASSSSTSTTATPSINKNNNTPSENQAKLTNNKDAKTSTLPDSRTDSAVNQLSSSSSDFELQELAMPSTLSSSATSESIDNTMALHREVTSFDGVSFDGELLKKDNAKSAFEITSVRPANTDDHDRSGIRIPVSNDSLRVILPEKGESGESEDSNVVAEDKGQVLSTDLDDSIQTKARFVVGGDPAEDEDLQQQQQQRTKNELHSNSSTNINQGSAVPPASGAATLPEDQTTGGALTHPVNSNASSSTAGGGGGGGVVAGNGSSVQPNWFRRVNQYERGRWTVRDSLVTEEQAETTTSTAPSQNTKQFQQLYKQQDPGTSDTVSNGTPPRNAQQQQQQRLEQTTDPTTSTELAMLPGISGGGGLGVSDATSDKDSSSVHMDRSSTAAETLSRNTSMSSIVPEKSVDGDEILHDIEVDSISGGGGAILNSVQNQEQEIGDVPTATLTQPQVLSTSSVGAVPPSSLTVLPREEQPPLSATASGESGKESNYEEVDLRRVKNAMSLLQDELHHVLTSSSNASLMEENRSLKTELTRMCEKNSKLEEENSRLKMELKQLKNSLSMLAQYGAAGGAAGAGGEAVTPSGRSEQQTGSAVTSSVNETSGNSQPQGFT